MTTERNESAERALEQSFEMTPFAQGVVEKEVEQSIEMTPFAQGVVEKELG